jgi:hypothetical protein
MPAYIPVHCNRAFLLSNIERTESTLHQAQIAFQHTCYYHLIHMCTFKEKEGAPERQPSILVRILTSSTILLGICKIDWNRSLPSSLHAKTAVHSDSPCSLCVRHRITQSSIKLSSLGTAGACCGAVGKLSCPYPAPAAGACGQLCCG